VGSSQLLIEGGPRQPIPPLREVMKRARRLRFGGPTAIPGDFRARVQVGEVGGELRDEVAYRRAPGFLEAVNV
jgi:hypothetical protein